MVDSTDSLKRIQVTTNFFQLEQTPIESVSIYSYSFTPDIESDNRSLRMQLLNKARSKIEERLGLWIRAGNTLYSKNHVENTFSVSVTAQDESEYLIIITHSGHVTGANKDSYRMYANSALKKMLQSLDLKQITKMPKYYDTKQTQRLEHHRLDIWRGYTASFSHHLRDMLLNVDFSSKIIRDLTALQAMEEIRKNFTQGSLLAKLNSELSGKIVMARYGNFKCYRVEEIILNENPAMDFMTKEGPISYVDYFRRKYNIDIKHPKQPLIKSFTEKGSKEIKLIPELCFMTGLSDEIRKDYKAMNDIASYARLDPQQRLTTSISLACKLSSDLDCARIADEYNIIIKPKALVVDSFRIDEELIKTAQTDDERVMLNRDGMFSVRNSMWKSVTITNWLVLTTEKDSSNRDKLIKTLLGKAGQIGLKLSAPLCADYNPRDIEQILGKILTSKPIQLVLVVVGPLEKKVYNDTKSLCALRYGIPTQCLKANNVNNPKKFDSIMSKLLIQMAVKTGSFAWTCPSPIPGLPIATMVVGIDVFHDTVQRAKSVLGFVASIHPHFTSYYNTTRIHERSGQEIAGHVGDCMHEALKAFHQSTKNRFLPEVIVVFRDGVANSQIQAAQDAEVSSIKALIAASFPNYSPKLVYVIVNKKTNAKLFIETPSGFQNPRPGTLINSMIIPEDESFYLISHFVKSGMASPTLYRIIENEKKVDLMTIARLAFKLCYLYYNWTGGIKVPAPTMMAHKLAFLVGQSVHQTHHENLRLLPWFY
jgi:aubergine-like protein